MKYRAIISDSAAYEIEFNAPDDADEATLLDIANEYWCSDEGQDKKIFRGSEDNIVAIDKVKG